MDEIIQPQKESRVKKTMLNARVNLIFYFLTLILSFFSRKIFLDCLGANFIGLSGTLQNLLGFLNLAELGVSASISYSLYKPLFDKNQTQINELISVMGYLYRKIGFVILIGGIILSGFLPLIFSGKENDLSLPIIFFVYYGFLLSSLFGYFINYRQVLLTADQRNYVITGYYQAAMIIKTLVQIGLAYYTGSYYLWVAIEILFSVAYSFILNWKINLTYPWLKTEISQGKSLIKKQKLIIKNMKRIFLHRIGSAIQWQGMPILIYAYVSLKMVAYYENYTLLVTKLIGLLNSVLGSSQAAVGNLLAEGNFEKAERIFWQIMSLRFWIVSCMIIGLYYLLPPFITLWLGPEYVLPRIVLILIIINISIQLTQSCLGHFIDGLGLFNDVWSTLSQAAVFILCSVLLGNKFGLAGIILSSIISIFLCQGLWKPYYLYHYGFKKHISLYIKKWLNLSSLLCLIVIIMFFLEKALAFINPYISFLTFIEYATPLLLLQLVTSGIIMYVCNSSFREFIRRFIKKNK